MFLASTLGAGMSMRAGSGRVMWRIEQGAGYVFRAQRISSLYAPGVGVPR